jgi:signal transduction histidine kinase/DNA-binding response OmpR family regulator
MRNEVQPILADRPRATPSAYARQHETLLALTRSDAIDSGELARAFREITEAAAHGLDIARVGVWLYEDDRKEAMYSPDLYLRDENHHATAPMLGHAAFPTYFATLAKERVIPADDAHTHPATYELSAAYLTPLKIGALLDAPIRWQGRMVGLVCHEHVGPARTWTQEDINFAGSMADAVARAFSSNQRREAQEALAKANMGLEATVHERTLELAKANEGLRALHDTKTRMFQNVSHELRTPLTLILAPTEALLANARSEDVERLKMVQHNAFRLLGLINNVLDLAKLDNAAAVGKYGGAELGGRVVPTDMIMLVENLHAEVKELGARNGRDVELHVPDRGPLTYLVDPLHIDRILLNLLSNAIRHAPRGGVVHMSVGEDTHGLELRVADNGPGVPETERARIFERFHQTAGGKAIGGTGIGLAIVADLVDLMDGRVYVTERAGGGAEFVVEIPRARKTSARAESERDRPMERQAALSLIAADPIVPQERGTGPTVLIVEDEAQIRAELIDLFSPSFHVIACNNGREALAIADTRDIHAVVTDMMMPELDGLSLVKALRERHEFQNCPILMLSARSDVEDRIAGREVGIDAYLAKPFHRSELLAAVSGLLRARMKLVGDYLVHEPLGLGGQGYIYRATHLGTSVEAAIKIASTKNNEDGRRRLHQERDILTRLNHPNIVRVLEHGDHDAGFFLAMEYVPGATLYEHVRSNGALSEHVTRQVGLGVAAALRAVHEGGIIHRDVKPKNIMIARNGKNATERVRLIDFGVATDMMVATHEGETLAGTLAYLAPELLVGARPSVLTDVYSFGVTLFYCLTGVVPFKDMSKSELVEFLTSHEAIPSVAAANPNVSAGIDALIATAMARDPKVRFASMIEVQSALDALLVAGPVSPLMESIAERPTTLDHLQAREG